MTDKSYFAQWRDDIMSSIAFLTRLPLPVSEGLRARRISEAMRGFPLAGALIGLMAGLVYWVAGIFALPHFLCAALAIVAGLLATGTFHEDGFADVWDGVGGGQTKEAKLHIMHDSRLGTYGTCALICALLIKVGALWQIGNYEGHLQALGALMATGALSRAALVAASHTLPLAQVDGQASGAGQASFDHVREGALVALIVAVLTIGVLETIVCVLAIAATTYLWTEFLKRQIGGQTGDALGSVQVMSELAGLLVLAAILG